MNLDHEVTGDVTKMAIWSQDSLEYACEHGQRKLIWLLEAVRTEVRLEDALLTVGGAPGLRSRDLLRGYHA